VRDEDDTTHSITVPSLPAAPTMPSVPAVAVSESELVEGAVVGDYRVERKIGRGGTGDVYLGVHTLIAKRAAIKILRGDSEPAAVERFVAEARIVNEIGNSNIVDVFAFGTAPDGRAYLVMEWLQGETLRSRLTRGKLEVETACKIARQLVRALGAAHGKRVVHRDLKPDNVFLVESDALTVKLLDFGMAKLLRTDRMTQTASGAFIGTPMYVAPEQARGLAIDHRADIYTLGGVLFEMLTGQPPFVAKSAFEVVSMHMTQPAPRPSSFVQLPAELDELVEAMLAKEPAVRPPLGKIAEVLEGVIDPMKRPTTPHEVARENLGSIARTVKRPPTKPSPRLPGWLVAIVVAIVVGLVAAGAYALVHGLAR
jgi:serine/threonine-protein kinase